MTQRSNLRAALSGEEAPDLDVLRYAVVLGDMIEILTREPGLTFGDALRASLLARALPPPPARVETALLGTAFKIITAGRLPGAPDA